MNEKSLIIDSCDHCGFKAYSTFLRCPHCGRVNRDRVKHVEIIENGKVVTCPKCGDDNIIAVHPFDYVKQCENPKCPYHVNHPKGWKYQFNTGVHN